VFASEVAALNFIRTRIARGTTVYADEAGAWNTMALACAFRIPAEDFAVAGFAADLVGAATVFFAADRVGAIVFF
jgi:hypothetical protein